MSTPQKILTTALWGCAVLGMLLFLALSNASKRNAESAHEQTFLFDLPAFSLLDQDAKPVTDAQLRGKPFVASFVFTHCAGPCPMMFSKMQQMQKTVTNPAIKLVTFTVDPDRDTPEVLKAKAKDLDADESRWIFLTGTRDSVEKLLRGMLQAKPNVEAGDDPLMHDTKFYLFDADGHCRGTYFSKDDEQLAKLAKDAEALAEGKSL